MKKMECNVLTHHETLLFPELGQAICATKDANMPRTLREILQHQIIVTSFVRWLAGGVGAYSDGHREFRRNCSSIYLRCGLGTCLPEHAAIGDMRLCFVKWKWTSTLAS